MSNIVLKRPTKLQREVTKIRYETAIHKKQLEHNQQRREASLRWAREHLIHQRREREAAIAAQERTDRQMDWMLAIVGGVIIFTIGKVIGVI